MQPLGEPGEPAPKRARADAGPPDNSRAKDSRARYETEGRRCIGFFTVDAPEDFAAAREALMPEPGEEGSPQRPTDAYAAEYTVFLLGEEETLSGHLDPEFRCYVRRSDLSSAVEFRSQGSSARPRHTAQAVIQGGFPHSARIGSEEDARRFAEELRGPPRDGWRLEDCGAEVPEAPGAAPDVRVLHASLAGPSSEAARALHQRFEQLMFFFIDGLTQIQRSDPGWEVLFACVQHRPAGGQPQWVPAGIAALYRHFHYPDKTRLKLSQLFVLPPCRGRGVGRQLLRAAQEMALSDAGVVDFTLEDPTPIVTRMRDVADVERCVAAEWPVEAASDAVARFLAECSGSGSGGGEGRVNAHVSQLLLLPAWVAERLQNEFKISQRQAVTVWESLVLLAEKRMGHAGSAARALVTRRMESAQAKAISAASSKTITNLGGDCFVMARGGAGEPVEMDPEVHGEPNEEELRGQVDARLAEMERVATTVLRDA